MVDIYGFQVNIPYMDPMGDGTVDHYGTVDVVFMAISDIYLFWRASEIIKNIWMLRRDIWKANSQPKSETF